MKKHHYHVNPAMNRWEEEQRLLRMEKMISRAKSTLPPEARVGSKGSGQKKASPYAAETTWAVRRAGDEGGMPIMDVQELDGLIYSRVQEILGMPIMRRAAAARAAAGKGGSPYKSSSSSRGRRRPVWNEEWYMHTTSAPANLEDRPDGGIGSRNGAAPRPYDKSSSMAKPSSVPTGASRRNMGAAEATGLRAGRPPPISTSSPPRPGPGHGLGAGAGRGSLQRNTSMPHGTSADSRVLGRPHSARYSGSGEPPGESRGGSHGGAGQGSNALENSVMSAIAVLNPQSAAAQEAARRNKQQGAGRGAAAGSRSGPGASSGIPHPRAGPPHAAGSAYGPAGAASGRGRETVATQSLASEAAASTGAARPPASASRKPPPPAAPRASSARTSSGGSAKVAGGSPPAAKQAAEKKKPKDEEAEEDDYADEEFEDYEDDFEEDEEGGGETKEGRAKAGAEDGDGDGDGDGEEDGGGEGDEEPGQPVVDKLRQSVSALNGLVQLKIQQELSRSQALQQTPRQEPSSARGRSSTPGSGSAARESSRALLASMALVGTEEAEGQGQGGAALEDSGVMDGLRQSDLDYLDRLGADLHFHGEAGGNSDDEKALVIEPGAPAGTAKVWGDRGHHKAGDGTDTTGLQLLRERQEKERQKQDQAGRRDGAGEQGSSQQGLADGGERRASGASVSPSQQADDDDSVLLGETISPSNRTGAAAQMQAVGSALAALASSGQLNPDDAQDLRKETDALYGSLVQLHNLMTGPRGSELRPAPSNGAVPASGFTPTTLSPADSPNQTGRRGEDPNAHAPTIESRTSGGSWRCARESTRTPSVVPPEPLSEQRQSLAASGGTLGGTGAGAGATGDRSGESHIQLTPKNRLVAEDVAWMAGLVQSLSRSLAMDNGEVDLPGM